MSCEYRVVDPLPDEISIADRAKTGVAPGAISGVEPVGKDPWNVVPVRDSEDQSFLGIEEARVIAQHLNRLQLPLFPHRPNTRICPGILAAGKASMKSSSRIVTVITQTGALR